MKELTMELLREFAEARKEWYAGKLWTMSIEELLVESQKRKELPIFKSVLNSFQLEYLEKILLCER